MGIGSSRKNVGINVRRIELTGFLWKGQISGTQGEKNMMQSESDNRVEEQTPLISVIIPVYKVEKYLDKCIKSVIGQTYGNMEIILVDDGSPDKCGEMCDQYAGQHAGVTVIHQQNQGLAASRNNAAKQAMGEYITFIDSDDYVTPDYVEYLFGLISRYHADIAVGGYVYQNESGEDATPKEESRTALFSPEEAICHMNYGQGYGCFAWGKMYRTELIRNNPFPEGKIYEDLATMCRIMGNAGSIAYGNKQIYVWIQRQGSIMHSGFSDRQWDGMEAAEQQLAYISERYPSAVSSARYRYTAKAAELIAVCFSSGGDRTVFRRLREYANRYGEEVLRDPNAKRTMKWRIRAVKAGYFPARVCFGLHGYLKRKVF